MYVRTKPGTSLSQKFAWLAGNAYVTIDRKKLCFLLVSVSCYDISMQQLNNSCIRTAGHAPSERTSPMHSTAAKTTRRKRNLEAVFETDTTLVQNIQLNITCLHFPFSGWRVGVVGAPMLKPKIVIMIWSNFHHIRTPIKQSHLIWNSSSSAFVSSALFLTHVKRLWSMNKGSKTRGGLVEVVWHFP